MHDAKEGQIVRFIYPGMAVGSGYKKLKTGSLCKIIKVLKYGYELKPLLKNEDTGEIMSFASRSLFDHHSGSRWFEPL